MADFLVPFGLGAFCAYLTVWWVLRRAGHIVKRIL